MAEIAYLMGKSSGRNRYFSSAESYFKAKFKSESEKAGSKSESVVVTPEPLTLHGVLSHLAQQTTTYDVVHIVTHAGFQGMLYFGLSSDPGYSDLIREKDLETALDTWDTSGNPEWTPLWARKGKTGTTPTSVGDTTIIQIDGCDIGLCPNFISFFGEMFAVDGTIRASLRPVVFANDPRGTNPPTMGQARQRTVGDKDLLDFKPKNAKKRAAFDADFTQRYFDRLLASDEVTSQFMVDTLTKSDYVKHLGPIATAAGVGFFDIHHPVKPWISCDLYGDTIDFAWIVEEQEALEAAHDKWPHVTLAPRPLFDSDVFIWDDSNCPPYLGRAEPRMKFTAQKMEDPADADKKVDGTRFEFELPVAILCEPIPNEKGTWPREVNPEEPSEYAEAVFHARTPKKPESSPEPAPSLPL